MRSMQLDGISLRALTQELNIQLRGARVQQIYHPQPHALILKLWSPVDQTEHTLYVGFGQPPWFHLTRAKPDNPMVPSSFCMLLRKHLKNGFVEAVTQDGLERIADLTVRRPQRTYTLRAELLGQRGNVLLLEPTAKGPRVLGAAIQLPSRRLRPGVPYEAPPSQHKLDPLQAKQTQWQDLPREEVPAWRWVLQHVQGVGPRLAKELVQRAGLAPELSANQLDEPALNALWVSARQLLKTVADRHFEPCLYLDGDDPADAAPFPLLGHEHLTCQPCQTLSQAFDACLQNELPAARENTERTRLLKHLNAQIKKTQSALDHVAADLHRAEQYEVIKREADLIMMHLSSLAPGVTASLVDPAGQTSVDVHIDPRHSPVQAAQKRYARYKKLKRGVDKLNERQTTLGLELDYLQTAHTQVEQADTPQDLGALAEELGLQKPPDPRKKPAPPAGPRRFEAEGFVILVGRNSRQNDELTRKAHPEDLWLHARQRPGSHVVIKSNGNAQTVPQSVRLQAARLAAYYSKGRHAAKLPVICTRAKFLRKPKGAKPGLVLVSKEEQTLVVAPVNEETA